MKKLTILMIAVMAMSVQDIHAQLAKVMLQHNGNATLFEPTAVQKAIDASADGDTIYIPEGTYNESSITITKKISIIGQGTKSLLGDITVNIPGGSEMTSTLLYGVNADEVTIKSSMTNLHIDKCTFRNLIIKPQSTTTTKTYIMKDMVIERCLITYKFLTIESDKFENAIVRNCNISYYANTTKDLSFINCYMYDTTDYILYGNFINCKCRYFNNTINNSTSFVNCLLGSLPTSGTITNCYVDSKMDYTDEELKVKGYLGTDGTIVGKDGGTRPYNLVPAVPSLEDIKMDVNYNTKKLNVTVKVKAN
jgi:hypothetical protein